MRIVTPGTLTESDLLADKSDAVLLAVSRARRSASASPGRRSRTARSAWPSAAEARARRLARAARAGRGARRPRPAGRQRATAARDDHAPAGLAVRQRARPRASCCAQLRVASLAALRRRRARAPRTPPPAPCSPTPSTRRAARSRTCTGSSVQRTSELIDLPPATHRNLELTQHAARPRRADAAVDDRPLRHRHGQPRPAPVADAAAARPARRRRAPRRDRRAARRPASARCATSLRHLADVERIARAHRPAPGAAARARRPARDAAGACRACAPRCRAEGSVLLDDARRGAGAAGRRSRRCSARDRRRAGGAAARRRRDRRRARRRARRAARDQPAAATPSCSSSRRASASAPASPRCASSSTACTASSSRSRRRRRRKVPADYRRRQTMKNAERFITPELKAFEDKALSAGERALAREKALYDALLDALAPHLEPLSAVARSLAALDALAALAEQARSAPTGAGRASCKEPLHRDRARPPSGRRGAPAGKRQALHRQRLPARRAAAACSSSPARTWAARAPSCARSR